MILRNDLRLIADLVPPGARVLDIGCGDGALLEYLVAERGVDGRGIEISQRGVNDCVARGLFVVQGDADNDLGDYPDQSFDLVILSRTLQAVHRPREVLLDLVRIGRQAIVTVPNFAQWRVRADLLLRGRMPVTKSMPKTWYNTDNIHFCTIMDMFDLIAAEGLSVRAFVPHSNMGKHLRVGPRLANLLADQALFLLER